MVCAKIVRASVCSRGYKIRVATYVDWLQSLKQFFINVSYHIRVASLTSELDWLQVYDMTH